LTQRVFAALELPPELQRQLALLQKELKTAAPAGSVRWVRPEGIHLTLKFYGDVADGRLPEIQAGLARVAGDAAPMQLTAQGVGVFPSAARPSVVWAGLGGELAPLERLAAAVEAAAVRLGFKPEGRSYSPHLTLGRVNDGADARGLMAALREARASELGRFRPQQLSLIHSELRPGGSVYTRLSAVALGAVQRPAGV
jgi:2'-5' RNA ligase